MRRRLPLELRAIARALRERGEKLESIAARVGVTHQTVRAWTIDIPRPENRQGRRAKGAAHG